MALILRLDSRLCGNDVGFGVGMVGILEVRMDFRLRGNSGNDGEFARPTVIPAKAGIHSDCQMNAGRR
ncbi:hypothetical protein EAO82_10985 [Halopseudomonas pelagia]|uniref:Uncharacterized protein n=1 Tax=Halopseudomonas pelagia TaxID=553151 RepID=A0AA91U538_9GAMM|nr:hypothetical protein CO192_06205 [Halopseudomonas pelagia]QFY56842.1 hypothetical protein EAO82_10985 [Halopseudomonas pelagia]